MIASCSSVFPGTSRGRTSPTDRSSCRTRSSTSRSREPLCDLHAAGADEGVAILLRRKGVPIAFWMEELGSRRALRSDALADEIARRAGEEILAEAIRDELGRPFAPPPLPLLSVAICTRDGSERVARLLDSLGKTLPTVAEPNGSLDIIVVDNAPSDDRSSHARRRVGRSTVRSRATAWAELREESGDRGSARSAARIPGRRRGRGPALAPRPRGSGRRESGRRGVYGPGATPGARERAQVIFEQRGGFRRGFEKIRYGARLPGNPLTPQGPAYWGGRQHGVPDGCLEGARGLRRGTGHRWAGPGRGRPRHLLPDHPGGDGRSYTSPVFLPFTSIDGSLPSSGASIAGAGGSASWSS